jgi:hypothetical protein
MMKLAILAVVLLTACSTPVPVSRKFPELPPVLREECQDLIKLEKAEKTPFSIIDLLGTNIENYKRGVECKIKHAATVQWHDGQKKIFNETK